MPNHDQEHQDRLLDENECEQITTTSRATRWRWERKGRFPRRVYIGPRTARWRLSEIIAWMEGLPRSASAYDAAADAPAGAHPPKKLTAT